MGNAESVHAPFEQLTEANPKHRVYTAAELAAMGDDQVVFTRCILSSASAILNQTIQQEANEKSLPLCPNEKNNEFAVALMSPVPLDPYKRGNVWWVDEANQIHFQPWMYRLAFTKAVNLFEQNYNRVNRGQTPFPKQYFMEQIRRIKTRGYQRRCRQRKREAAAAAAVTAPAPAAPTPAPPQPPAGVGASSVDTNRCAGRGGGQARTRQG
jgi:hypothetical protein